MIKKINFMGALLLCCLLAVSSGYASPMKGDARPQLAFDPEINRYLTVYFNYSDSGYQSIKAMFVGSDGTAGDVFSIADGSTTQNYDDAFVVYDPTNRRFLVVYKKYDSAAPTSYDIWGQFVNQDGALNGAAFAINNATGLQRAPIAAYDSKNQRFLVIWDDYRDSKTDIWGQLIDKDGNKVGSEINISNLPGTDEYFGTVAYLDSKDEYLIAWQDEESNVWAKLVDKDGVTSTFPGAEIQGSAFTTGGPQVAWSNSSDRLMAVWGDTRNASYDIYGNLVDLDSSSNSNFEINLGSNYKTEPHVVWDSTNNRFFVVWLEEGLQPTLKISNPKPDETMGASALDIYAKYVDLDGTVSTDVVKVVEDTMDESSVSAAFNSNCSNVMVAYASRDKTVPSIPSVLGFKVVGDACSNPPSAPGLTYPENGATGLGTDVTLKWNKSEDPDGDKVSYDVLLCSDENFSGCETATVAALSKHENGYAMAGFTGLSALMFALLFGSSIVRRKKIYSAIAIFILIGFSLVQFGCGSNSASYKATGLSSATTYYWKVIASDGKGGITGSDTWSFTTK